MNRQTIARQSIRAPGLPYPPSQGRTKGATKIVSVTSINYDYLPMNLDSPKMLWVDLSRPAPDDLMVGTPVRLFISPDQGIQTQLSSSNLLNSVFQVDDIIGSRVVLSPYKGSSWLPTVHAPCDSPFGWGYNMRMANVSPSFHNTKYGYGVPISYLEYHPIYYSRRATQLEAALIDENMYRGTVTEPGW